MCDSFLSFFPCLCFGFLSCFSPNNCQWLTILRYLRHKSIFKSLIYGFWNIFSHLSRLHNLDLPWSDRVVYNRNGFSKITRFILRKRSVRRKLRTNNLRWIFLFGGTLSNFFTFLPLTLVGIAVVTLIFPCGIFEKLGNKLITWLLLFGFLENVFLLLWNKHYIQHQRVFPCERLSRHLGKGGKTALWIICFDFWFDLDVKGHIRTHLT